MLIQEPPWVRVGTARSLTSPQGDAIFGLPTLSGFNVFLPDPSTWSASSATERPRSILLVHKRWSTLSIYYQQALSSTRDIVTVLLKCKWTDGTECPLYISSIYNGAPSEPNTVDQVLNGYSIPTDCHWILGGDFNCHHSDWSECRAVGASPGQARSLHSFIQSRGMFILNDPAVPT